MTKPLKRTPRNYDGIDVTNRDISQVLSSMLNKMEQNHRMGGQRILEGWKDLVGEKIASMTKATRFQKGILQVKVDNSTLYSLLVQQSPSLLDRLKKKFPHVEFTKIHFFRG